MAMCEGTQTVGRTTEGDSNAFVVKQGLHEKEALDRNGDATRVV